MTFVDITEIRFKIKSASSSQVVPGQDGIIAVVASEYQSSDMNGSPLRTLVTMVDMQSKNKGCSLTNGIETAINYIANQMNIHGQSTRWIEMDSEGYFDEVSLRLDASGKECIGVGWMPLKASSHSRTVEAFVASFDALANETLQQLKITSHQMLKSA